MLPDLCSSDEPTFELALVNSLDLLATEHSLHDFVQILLETELDDEIEQFPGQLLVWSVQDALLVWTNTSQDGLLHKLADGRTTRHSDNSCCQRSEVKGQISW